LIIVRPYRLDDQIVFSSISIPSIIADGSKWGGDIEFVKFIGYSGGSTADIPI
jgi:four helix bundle protein